MELVRDSVCCPDARQVLEMEVIQRLGMIFPIFLSALQPTKKKWLPTCAAQFCTSFKRETSFNLEHHSGDRRKYTAMKGTRTHNCMVHRYLGLLPLVKRKDQSLSRRGLSSWSKGARLIIHILMLDLDIVFVDNNTFQGVIESYQGILHSW